MCVGPSVHQKVFDGPWIPRNPEASDKLPRYFPIWANPPVAGLGAGHSDNGVLGQLLAGVPLSGFTYGSSN